MSADAAWLPTMARRLGAACAIEHEGRRTSWCELADAAGRIAAGLHALGVARGDLVAARFAPQPSFVALLHALQMLGATLLPLNLRLTEIETAAILAHAEPRLVVDDGATAATAGSRWRRCAIEELLADREARSFRIPSGIDPDALLTVVYTSGTSAAPKGVMLTNANYAASAAASRRRLGHGAEDSWLATLPFFHVGGLAILARSALEGSRILLQPVFDVARARQVIEGGEASMISVVPTMLARVMETLGRPSPSLRCLLVGGAALSPTLAQKALDAGLPVSATYGMTEACSQICSSAPGSADAARGSVGRPLDGTTISIAGADRDGWGEILVRGPTVMRGYLRNRDADRVALRGGWLHSGDVGRIDADGTLMLAGRRDDLIVSGGENVSPLEVEHVLDAHASVSESLVIGADDEDWGQRVVAVVVLREGRSEDAASLGAWCRGRLAGYKVPREFRFTSALPRGATGKPLRRMLP